MSIILLGQTDSVFKLTTLRGPVFTKSVTPGIDLNHCWKFQKGDNSLWADTNFSDKSWKYSSTQLPIKEFPQGYFENCVWFRLWILADSQFLDKPIALMVNQLGASEIYLDGKLVKSLGKIDPGDPKKDESIHSAFEPHAIVLKGGKKHLIAVRYRNKDAVQDFKSNLISETGFEMKLGEIDDAVSFLKNDSFFYKAIMVFYFAFFLALGILHLLLFSFYPKNKSNLYYSGFTLFFGMIFLLQALLQITNDTNVIKNILKIGPYLPLFYSASILAMLYSIFYKKILKVLWLWIGLMIIYLVTHELNINIRILNQVLTAFVVAEPIRIIIVAIYRKKEGAWIIGSGVITTVCFFTAAVILLATGHGNLIFNSTGLIGAVIGIVVLISTVSIPLSMSAYLARQFSKTNNDLEKKLIEVEKLSARSIEQEKEKQKILAEQNITLEEQVKERTEEIVHQKKMIEEKQKEIIDSIKYAKRIQQSLMPTAKYLERIFNKRN